MKAGAHPALVFCRCAEAGKATSCPGTCSEVHKFWMCPNFCLKNTESNLSKKRVSALFKSRHTFQANTHVRSPTPSQSCVSGGRQLCRVRMCKKDVPGQVEYTSKYTYAKGIPFFRWMVLLAYCAVSTARTQAGLLCLAAPQCTAGVLFEGRGWASAFVPLSLCSPSNALCSVAMER